MGYEESRIPTMQEQLETLKQCWHRDPCWDIETTVGFENYRDELLAYRLSCASEWKTPEASSAEKWIDPDTFIVKGKVYRVDIHGKVVYLGASHASK